MKSAGQETFEITLSFGKRSSKPQAARLPTILRTAPLIDEKGETNMSPPTGYWEAK
jgi:hypothetical protein